jgi:hypothetical protein
MPTDLKRPICKNPDCRRQFTKQQGTNRLYCYDCRPERKILDFPTQNGQNDPDSAENPENDGPLTRKSLKQLEEWGIEETWQAEAVLTLARQIDSGKGGGSAGVAGAIKAHREAMSVAHAVSEVDDGDVIDMIFAERS